MVPTTISDNAVAMRSQIDIRVATSARPSHRAAKVQISVVALSRPKDLPHRKMVPRNQRTARSDPG